ncbi:MAG: hypothetical protein AAF367_07435 [Pseudomonadota bacterium]
MKKTALLASAALIALTAPATSANTIGAVSALNQDVDGTPPEADTRLLVLGDGVFQNERIESSPIGSGQFLFLDQTSLTIAKESVLVLDKYVYDPETRSGEFSMSMTRGVLRFVGGRITKGTDAVITTPTATIGIRGGMAIIIVEEDGTTRVMHIAGDYTRVTSLGSDEIIINRSNGVGEARPGGGVEYLGVADRELITSTSRALTGRGEAGERVEPQEADIAQSGLPEANSARKGASQEQPISTRGALTRDTSTEDEEPDGFTRTEEEITTTIALVGLPDEVDPGIGVLLPGVFGAASFAGSDVPGVVTGDGPAFAFTQVFEGSRIGVTADDEVFIIPTSEGFFSFTAPDGASPVGGISGSGFFDSDAEFTFAVFETAGQQAGAFLTGRAAGPLANADAGTRTARFYGISDDLFTGNGAAFTPGILSGFSGEGQSDLILLSNTSGAAIGGNARALSTYLSIDGTGVNQTSGFGVLTADVIGAEGGTLAFADSFEGSFDEGDGGATRVTTTVATAEDGFGNSAFGTDANYFALTSSRDFGDDPNPGRAIAGNGVVTLFGSNNVAGLDAVASFDSSEGTTLSGGYASATGRDLGTGQRFAGSSSGPTGASGSVVTGSNTATMTITLDQTFAGALNFEAPALQSLTVTYGGGDGRSGAISETEFAARQATAGTFLANGVEGANVQDGQGGQGAFRGALASAALAGNGGIFPAGISPTSSVLTWGWWGGDFRTAASPDPGSAIDDQRIHLGAWVAGDLTGSANLPLQGVATYEGFAVVSAIQDGVSFTDGAGYGLTYDFAERLGTATFTDLLGANAEIAVSEASFGNDYQGTAGIVIGGREGLIGVDGAFFNGPGGAADGTAGAVNFATNDGTIAGSGVFVGDRLN